MAMLILSVVTDTARWAVCLCDGAVGRTGVRGSPASTRERQCSSGRLTVKGRGTNRCTRPAASSRHQDRGPNHPALVEVGEGPVCLGERVGRRVWADAEGDGEPDEGFPIRSGIGGH